VCNGTNVVGSESSNATSFVVVPNPREYEHLAFPTNIRRNKINVLEQDNSLTVDGITTTNVTKKQGQEVELLCIVEYSNELQTSISWNMETLSGVTSVANKTFKKILLELQSEITVAKLLTCLATTAQQSQ